MASVRRVERNAHAYGTAEGQAAERDPSETQVVEQLEQLRSKSLNGAVIGEKRAPVPGMVVAQDAEPLGQSRCLQVPQRERRAERARKDDDAVSLPFDLVMERHRPR